MTTSASPSAEKAWARVDDEKRRDRFLRRLSIAGGLPVHHVRHRCALRRYYLGMQVAEMARAYAAGVLPWATGRRICHPPGGCARHAQRPHRHAEHGRYLSCGCGRRVSRRFGCDWQPWKTCSRHGQTYGNDPSVRPFSWSRSSRPSTTGDGLLSSANTNNTAPIRMGVRPIVHRGLGVWGSDCGQHDRNSDTNRQPDRRALQGISLHVTLLSMFLPGLVFPQQIEHEPCVVSRRTYVCQLP